MAIPDRFYIDKSDRKLYEKIEEEEMFKGKNRKDEFLFAMAIGFKNKVKPSLKTPKDGFFLTKDLKPEDEALINAMAVWESNSVDVLSNKEEVFKIAEEYAHGGARILHDSIGSTQFGSFSKQFEKMLHEIYEELMNERV